MKRILPLFFLLFPLFLSAQTVYIPDANFKLALINSGVDTNGNGEIEEAEALLIEILNVFDRDIEDLEGIKAFANLKSLNCKGNLLTELDLDGLIFLEELYCFRNNCKRLDLRSLSNLKEVNCTNNNMEELLCSGLQNLKSITASNNLIVSIEVNDLPTLTTINLGDNKLLNLDLRGAPNLENVFCYTNEISTVNLEGLKQLLFINCFGNMLTELDLSGSPKMDYIDCHDNQLSYLNVKNGSSEINVNFNENPNIKYVCTDDFQSDMILDIIANNNYTECVLNSYCSFVPGGEYFTLSGKNTYDVSNDGCQNDTIHFPYLKYKIEDGNDFGYFFSYANGYYQFPVSAGDYTYEASIENPEYFYIDPALRNVSFPGSTDPVVQDFCIQPNGDKQDLSISLIPTSDAIPGYLTKFKIIYENKGNMIMDGSVTFWYDGTKMDFQEENSSPDQLEINFVKWEFSELLPFEKRNIEFGVLLNKPTDNPPLNDGEIISFAAVIEDLSSDETPEDNEVIVNLSVTNSFDPNDKACLEGAKISKDKIGQFLRYKIRFENTGSAAAKNIVIKDIIDINQFEIESLLPLDGSHEFQTRIFDDNIVEFIFEDINLPFDDQSNDGYLVFKIKTKEDLQIGEIIRNKAEIYFDFNFPIITNTAETLITILSSNTTEDHNKPSISISPNPAKAFIELSSNTPMNEISIFNTQGILVMKKQIKNQLTRKVDLQGLDAGFYIAKIKNAHKEALVRFIKN